MTQEGIRGDEESPDNSMVLKTLFVRMLAGAGDHTSCYFADRVDDKLGSHASQLAKTICIYSPWQFLYWYDRPMNSVDKVGGAGGNDKFIIEVPELTFFDQVPTVWDDTKVIEGYPGKFAVVARKSRTTWFVGALNGDQERDYNIPLDFLDPNSQYKATVFTDNDEVKTQTKVAVETLTVTSEDVVKNRLKKHEGMAIIIKKSI
jgi:alpha-glucosidase